VSDDLPNWAIQVACEQLGLKGLWEATTASEFNAVIQRAERICR